ncbi:hypothetical protein KAR91_56520, partial [Candidatus Pacearchaeota archaeon]|nr:hypothetical protein [Candidatus Pacearchaeota archaeon]
MKKRQQKCGQCRYAFKCYSEKTTPRNVVINILACRIRMNIKREESSRLLLEMVKPSLIKLANNARARVGNGYVNMEDMIRDLESRVIECLLDEENGYRIGESAYLTEYLFGTNPRTGWVRKWVLWDFSKHRRFYTKHNLTGNNPKSDSEEIKEHDRVAIIDAETSSKMEDNYHNKNTINALINIIDDGITLNANEYRVISFCLAHANESNKTRLIDGTHTYLSSIMKVSRPRITRLYSV